jgi:hypothetical protein
MSITRTRGARLIRLLITVLAAGAAISGFMNLMGMPRTIVQHWEQTSFGTEFLWYLTAGHHHDSSGDLTLKRMGCGAMEIAGALFLWPSHTAATSSRWSECIGSSILLFMFTQGAMINRKLGLEREFLVTSIASFLAFITLLHGISSTLSSSSNISDAKNKGKSKKI